MSRLEESKSFVLWAKVWSLIVAFFTCGCAVAFTIRLKDIHKNDWTVIVCASVALIIGLSSIVAGIVFYLKNKYLTILFVKEFKKKHGVPLSLSLRPKDQTYSAWDKGQSVATGAVWGLGCVWSLVLLVMNKHKIDEFDWWFAIAAHLANCAVAFAFTVLFHFTADYMKIIGRGTTPTSSSVLPIRSPSPQNLIERREGIELKLLEPMVQETRRSERVSGQAQGEAELRARISNSTDADNVTAAIVESRPISNDS